MKQVQKTEQVMGQLRAAFGPDADLTTLAVYETVALNSLPLRKAGGVFKGARNSLRVLQQLADWVSRESVPVHVSHDTSGLPYGRVFHAGVNGEELRLLFAIDGAGHPDVVSKLDSGVLDQVSVGFNMKSLTCSKCGFNYVKADAEHFWSLTCDEGHEIGKEGTHVWVDDLEYFFELSLVGMGAVEGAQIVGRSDARLAQNPQAQQRLAASANSGLVGVRLSPTIEDQPTMNAEQLARFEASIAEAATAKAEVTSLTAQLQAVTAERDALAAAAAEPDEPAPEVAELEAARAAAAVATETLQGELSAVLTALGETVPAELPTDVAELAAQLKNKRAAFAAIIPVDGLSNKERTTETAPVRSTAAFRSQN